MKDRLEWELVPRVREESIREVEEIAEQILYLDGMIGPEEREIPDEYLLQLHELKERLSLCLLSPCEAAGAPLLSSRPGWRKEAAAAWKSLPEFAAMPLSQFTKIFAQQHDCTRCPGASAFPGSSGIPCKVDLEPLLAIVSNPEIIEQVQYELAPHEMRSLADELERYAASRRYNDVKDVDPAKYLTDLAHFLRFWADQKFGVSPTFLPRKD